MDSVWKALSVGICVLLISGGPAWAFLDFLKSPATLILNQNNCTFMGSTKGEVVNGKIILSGVGVVVMSMEQLDANRVIGTMQRGDALTFVMDVQKSKGTISAIRNLPGPSVTILQCSL